MKCLIAIVACSLLLSTVAFTQEADKKFNLEVNGTDINLIGEGLGTLPYSKVAPLMQKLQSQITAQQQPSVAPTTTVVPPSGRELPPSTIPKPN